MTLYAILLGVFGVLNALDCFLTVKGLEGSDNIKEKNPIAKALMKFLGVRAGAIALKVFGAFLFISISYNTPAWLVFFAVANIGYGYLVYNNYNVLKRNGVKL